MQGATEERSRLAREMHDSVAKSLQGIALGAAGLAEADEVRVAVEAVTGDLAEQLDLEVALGRGGRYGDCSGFVPERAVFSGTLSDLAAVPAYLAAGLAGVPYRRFLGWVTAASAARAAVLIGLGVLFGRQAADLLNNPVTAIALTVALAVFVTLAHLVVRRWAGRRFRPVNAKEMTCGS